MDTWNSIAKSYPDSSTAAWLKKPGEPGYIGDITVDLNDTEIRASGRPHAMWDMYLGQVILPSRPSERLLASALAHEAGGHAFFATRVPYIDIILPPRYAVGMYIISEIHAFLQQSQIELGNHNYDVPKNIKERPIMERDANTYFHRLHQYIANTNPRLDANAVWQRACNEFALGFLSNDIYLDNAISALLPQFYELMHMDGKIYTPPVLNRRSSQYMANIDIIMRKYLEEAMPAGVPLTVDVNVFIAELMRNIDRVDLILARLTAPTCASYDEILLKSVQEVEALGHRVLDGGMYIWPDTVKWLDELVGPPRPVGEAQVVQTMRKLYSRF